MKQPKMNEVKYNKKGTQEIRKAMAQTKKIKITINFDADILNEIKNMADETGTPYQTLLNRIVRSALNEKKSRDSRLDKLEKEIEKIKKKIA